MYNNNDKKYKHRMGTKKVTMVGMDGNPLRNTEVEVKQIKHEFLFGCAEFSCIPLANNEFNGDTKEKAEEMFRKFFDLFNCVTLPFYWEGVEPAKGQPNTEKIKNTAQWLMSNGCVLKGHPLCWHTLAPSWLLDMDNSQILCAQLERIKREVTEFAGLIDIWDVINEVVIMPIFNKYDNGITRICKDMGRIRTVREVFLEAKKSNPNSVLLINDFIHPNPESYYILIEGCLEAGIPIDAIGIQSHMHKGYWGIEKTQEMLELFSNLNLPIHFTENTLVSGHTMPQEIDDFNDYKVENWPTTPDGEERQAREAVMHYKTLFEHPQVGAITWWDFVDGQWLGAPVGLMTKENRIKPIYEELYKLIKEEWWTSPVHTVTDESGSITFTGFLGEYQVACSGNSGNFIMGKQNEGIEGIVVTL